MTAQKKKGNNNKKTTAEQKRTSTRFARQAADLNQSGRALLRLARQLQRESEKALRRSTMVKTRTTEKKQR